MPDPLRLFLLPNELIRFGGAEAAGRAAGAGEVWNRPPIGQAPRLLWSRFSRPTPDDHRETDQ